VYATRNAVALRHRVPNDQIGDRSVVGSHAQLLWRETPVQAQADLGLRSGAQDIPGFGLAVLQPDGPRKCVVWMNLNGKGLAGEQQLQQQRSVRGLAAGPLVSDFADSTAVMACIAPRKQIYDTPGL